MNRLEPRSMWTQNLVHTLWIHMQCIIANHEQTNIFLLYRVQAKCQVKMSVLMEYKLAFWLQIVCVHMLVYFIVTAQNSLESISTHKIKWLFQWSNQWLLYKHVKAKQTLSPLLTGKQMHSPYFIFMMDVQKRRGQTDFPLTGRR